MTDLNLKPTLGQRSNFIHYAMQDEHFDIFDWETQNLGKMSLEEFNYLKRNWVNKHYMNCKVILSKYVKLK